MKEDRTEVEVPPPPKQHHVLCVMNSSDSHVETLVSYAGGSSKSDGVTDCITVMDARLRSRLVREEGGGGSH